jgi:parvulin-like peptidyl-prolyl isomerase
LYRCLWLIAGALAWATWAPPGTLSDILSRFDVQLAQAQPPSAYGPPIRSSNPYGPADQPPSNGPGTYPQNPGSFSRPVDPPGASIGPPGANMSGPPVGTAVTPPVGAQAFEPAQILATVGSEVILSGDINTIVNEMISQKAPDAPPEQVEQIRAVLTKQLVNQMIETKLVFADAKRTIPAANFPKVEEDVGKNFEKTQLPKMLKNAKVNTRLELDELLRKAGTSLDAQKQAYFEKTLAMQWFQNQIKVNEDFSPDEMLAYYHAHLTDFDITAKARWEELMVRFDKYPTKEAAWQDLAAMGDQVLRGTAFAEVAKARSQGPTASEGGAYEMTTKGSLSSALLDAALFSLPVGRMSQIIETDRGFHIVRVVERVDAGRTSFPEAQSEIRKKLKNERFKKQMQEYLAKLREQTAVRTVFDPPAGNEQGGTAQVGSRPGDTVPR